MIKIPDIKSIDPKIYIQKKEILIKPFYFNYAFLINFFPIALLIFVPKSNLERYILCYALILVGLGNIFSQLQYYNTILIDVEKNLIYINPNLFWKPFIKQKILNFNSIKKISTVSNVTSSDARYFAYRYFIVASLDEGEDLKLISSNKETIAKEISKLITSVLS